eukprot:324637-Chlamydomonas_euryale.AAC.1
MSGSAAQCARLPSAHTHASAHTCLGGGRFITFLGGGFGQTWTGFACSAHDLLVFWKAARRIVEGDPRPPRHRTPGLIPMSYQLQA